MQAQKNSKFDNLSLHSGIFLEYKKVEPPEEGAQVFSS